MGEAKIEAFLDCGMCREPMLARLADVTVSPYSYYASTYLLKNRAALSSHGVEVEYVTFLLKSSKMTKD
jgi:hypothetical protein